ncbi:FliM/FliN family flagellar motor switch protein [Insolitispirillum peregrinum]|uniref:Flagellar motor switch protein FliN n=2 Tax=Insolitispirillum peregrinum TaxID=80876 RepID=A0A1N7JKE7_9PROT|nr:FliM/FliN family flagellar motor switch protein [Insolitispirillum peregrinum]SIS49716.1 flagellar motor switch protein FliN/FliY [Insolitispirillum peregrinum]
MVDENPRSMDDPDLDTIGGNRQLTSDAIFTVPVEISVVLGKSELRVNQLLKLGRGAVVELDQRTDDPVEIYANDILVARGEVVITEGDRIGVTLTELVKSIYAK